MEGQSSAVGRPRGRPRRSRLATTSMTPAARRRTRVWNLRFTVSTRLKRRQTGKAFAVATLRRSRVTGHVHTDRCVDINKRWRKVFLNVLKRYENLSPLQPFLFLLQYLLHKFSGLFTVISEHICFLLLLFLFLHFLIVGSVR